MHLTEAKRAIVCGMNTDGRKNMFYFNDLRQTNISDLLIGSTDDIEIYIYPPLRKLLEYNQTEALELITTLYEYLSHPKDIQDICDKLFIHKNTLFYRMNKIREIMGVKLYNGAEITQTMISLDLLHTADIVPLFQGR